MSAAWRRCARYSGGISETADCELLERISHIFGIFRAINTILPVPARADDWLRRPNDAPIFGGTSAIDEMTSGKLDDLLITRQYLEAQ